MHIKSSNADLAIASDKDVSALVQVRAAPCRDTDRADWELTLSCTESHW